MDALSEFRLEIGRRLKSDAAIREVVVRAPSVREALRDASIQLGEKPSSLEYEVLEKGSAGVLGFAVKPWLLRVYCDGAKGEARHVDLEGMFAESQVFGASESESEKPADADGKFFVHYIDGKIVLKVTRPVGNGKPVLAGDILSKIRRLDGYSFNSREVEKLAKKTTEGEYAQIGSYPNISGNDAKVSIEVSPDEMVVTMRVSAPSRNGSELSAKKIVEKIKGEGVIFGLCDDEISKFADSPIYGAPYVVARGAREQDGKDAFIDYKFDMQPNARRGKIIEGGQVDFKALDIAQNVVEGQVLAVKVPPSQGVPGKTVRGKFIPAKDGKDIPMPLGKNTEIGNDKNTIVATMNGQVLLVANKISVDPILEIQGDVGIKTGNIAFLGTVRVRGNVEDGFDIKTSGNVEIFGSVGACHIESEGDVSVNLGVMGKDSGTIRAGGSIFAKFIQNATIEAGGNIVVGDGIINSNATSKKKIVVQGKRAVIMGGRIFAMEEVGAKCIGSDAGGAETVVEVGYDPVKKKRLDELLKSQQLLVKELDEVARNISTLDAQKSVQNFLSADKEEQFQNLVVRRNEIMDESDAAAKEIADILEYLQSLKAVGRISVSDTIYPGVKIFIRDLREDIRVPSTKCTFVAENNVVRQIAYIAPSLE